MIDFAEAIKNYSFPERKSGGNIHAAEKMITGKTNENAVLLIGYGGTISSGYTPTKETIVPLFPSPAIKQIEYMNIFGTSNLEFESIDALSKDSRDILVEDLFMLLDILHLVPHTKVLITTGTYMLPKISLFIQQNSEDMPHKVIVLTGSILPAGFVASDADANIWSALTVLNYRATTITESSQTLLVFHGRVFETKAEFESLNLHPAQLENLVIQYPLTSVPTGDIL